MTKIQENYTSARRDSEFNLIYQHSHGSVLFHLKTVMIDDNFKTALQNTLPSKDHEIIRLNILTVTLLTTMAQDFMIQFIISQLLSYYLQVLYSAIRLVGHPGNHQD